MSTYAVAYRDYLASAEWRRNRARLISARCERCGATNRLQLHHRTYKRLGYERRTDVETLCDPCHRSQHRHWPARRRRSR